jgi:hypothetical protein
MGDGRKKSVAEKSDTLFFVLKIGAERLFKYEL